MPKAKQYAEDVVVADDGHGVRIQYRTVIAGSTESHSDVAIQIWITVINRYRRYERTS
ncbi:MAG: hypothetical protein KDB00_11660 [Planctomycetales bacterium]|nr:hypothetical protein [Planctomycetales bacterium]